MPCSLYALLTWTTRERAELIDADCAAFLQEFLLKAAARQGIRVGAIGIVANHVHMLLALPARLDIPAVVQQLKGASARIVNRDRRGKQPRLRWAAGYQLQSVSPRAVDRVSRYVRQQAQRHPQLAVRSDGRERNAAVPP